MHSGEKLLRILSHHRDSQPNNIPRCISQQEQLFCEYIPQHENSSVLYPTSRTNCPGCIPCTTGKITPHCIPPQGFSTILRQIIFHVVSHNRNNYFLNVSHNRKILQCPTTENKCSRLYPTTGRIIQCFIPQKGINLFV